MPIDPKPTTLDVQLPATVLRSELETQRRAPVSDPWSLLQLQSEAAADRRQARVVAQALQNALCDMVLPALLSTPRAHHTQPRSLRAAHAAPHGAAASGLCLHSDHIAAFAELLIDGEDATLDAVLSFWRQQGLSLESLLVDGLHGASQLLGLWWEQDQCDFATVTACTARLQRLMQWATTSLYAEHAVCRRHVFGTAHRPRIWLGAAPGEQHRFGLTMAAELFSLAGWDVLGLRESATVQTARDVNATLLLHAARGGIDAVGFSVGSESQQIWTRDVVDNLRSHAKLTHHRVLLGGPLVALRPDLVSSWGADLLCPRGELAPLAAQQLLVVP